MIGLAYILQIEGLTGRGLASRLGVSQPLVSQWINGSKQIPTNQLIEINKIIGNKYPLNCIVSRLTDDLKVQIEKYGKDEMSEKLANILIERFEARKKVMEEVAELLDIPNLEYMLREVNDLKQAKLIYNIVNAAIPLNSRYIVHDLQALSKLEQERRRDEVENEKAFLVLTILISAFCEVMGIDDDTDKLFPISPKAKDPSNPIRLQVYETVKRNVKKKKAEYAAIIQRLINECDI